MIVPFKARCRKSQLLPHVLEYIFGVQILFLKLGLHLILSLYGVSFRNDDLDTTVSFPPE